jgi:SAM-dependent methyltransferase
MKLSACRVCFGKELETFLNLGLSPIANELILEKDREKTEAKKPLHALVCMTCSLVQLSEVSEREEIFNEGYVYFSSYSSSWVEHARVYCNSISEKLALGPESLVVEVASNDGYLLKHFKQAGIPVLGVEPARDAAAAAAEDFDIESRIEFFGQQSAIAIKNDYGNADLLIANNVLAHVPDLHDFVSGFSMLLGEQGVATFEFPHLNNLIQFNEFDTIYHEHYSYLNITPLILLFKKHGMRIFDVEKLKTHGGSLRIYVSHENSNWSENIRVKNALAEEQERDPRLVKTRSSLSNAAENTKIEILEVIGAELEKGKVIAAYGAAAKGNTLLNFAGITSEDISYVVDQNPHKQGKLLPGSRIPIVGIEHLLLNPPDIILILPWNLSDEIVRLLRTEMKLEINLLRAIPKVEFF